MTTVSTKVSRLVVEAPGAANPIHLDQLVESASHIELYADDDLEPLAIGTYYSVSGVGDEEGVEILLTQAALDITPDTWTIVHNPPVDQDYDLSAGGSFGQAYERGLDALTRRMQAMREQLARSVKMPTNYVGGAPPLPTPEANKYIAWSSDGDSLVNKTLISAADLVDQASAYIAVGTYIGAHGNWGPLEDPAVNTATLWAAVAYVVAMGGGIIYFPPGLVPCAPHPDYTIDTDEGTILVLDHTNGANVIFAGVPGATGIIPTSNKIEVLAKDGDFDFIVDGFGGDNTDNGRLTLQLRPGTTVPHGGIAGLGNAANCFLRQYRGTGLTAMRNCTVRGFSHVMHHYGYFDDDNVAEGVAEQTNCLFEDYAFGLLLHQAIDIRRDRLTLNDGHNAPAGYNTDGTTTDPTIEDPVPGHDVYVTNRAGADIPNQVHTNIVSSRTTSSPQKIRKGDNVTLSGISFYETCKGIELWNTKRAVVSNIVGKLGGDGVDDNGSAIELSGAGGVTIMNVRADCTGRNAWGVRIRDDDTDLPKTVTGITAANPAVLTVPSHGYSTGQSVTVYEVLGMTQINGLTGTATVINANSFSLDIDASAFTAYASGGIVQKRKWSNRGNFMRDVIVHRDHYDEQEDEPNNNKSAFIVSDQYDCVFTDLVEYHEGSNPGRAMFDGRNLTRCTIIMPRKIAPALPANCDRLVLLDSDCTDCTVVFSADCVPGGQVTKDTITDNGSNNRIVYLRDGDAISPRDFGAKLDGVTDDSAAFTRAIAFAKARKVPIEIKDGEVLLNSTRQVIDFDGFTLRCVGTGRIDHDLDDAPCFSIGTDAIKVKRFTFENVHIKQVSTPIDLFGAGASSFTGTTRQQWFAAVYVRNAEYGKFKGCTFEDFFKGIFFDGNHDGAEVVHVGHEVTHCTAIDCTYLVLANMFDDLDVSFNRMRGFQQVNTDDGTLLKNPHLLYKADRSSSNSARLRAIGNTVEGCDAGPAFALRGLEASVVSGNITEAEGAIFADYCVHCVFSDHTHKTPSESGDEFQSALESKGCKFSVFTDMTIDIRNANGYGLRAVDNDSATASEQYGEHNTYSNLKFLMDDNGSDDRPVVEIRAERYSRFERLEWWYDGVYGQSPIRVNASTITPANLSTGCKIIDPIIRVTGSADANLENILHVTASSADDIYLQINSYLLSFTPDSNTLIDPDLVCTYVLDGVLQ